MRRRVFDRLPAPAEVRADAATPKASTETFRDTILRASRTLPPDQGPRDLPLRPTLLSHADFMLNVLVVTGYDYRYRCDMAPHSVPLALRTCAQLLICCVQAHARPSAHTLQSAEKARAGMAQAFPGILLTANLREQAHEEEQPQRHTHTHRVCMEARIGSPSHERCAKNRRRQTHRPNANPISAHMFALREARTPCHM